jgi:MFS family permease
MLAVWCELMQHFGAETRTSHLMNSIRPLIPLLIAAGILLAGNGLQGTFIALRGAEEGFSTSLIGFMGTSYFGGFLLGCIAVPRMLQSVGHIRTFAALAAIATAATLGLVLWIDATVWIILRLVVGFCFSGLFTAVDSWINSSVANEDRGRVLSLYRLIDLACVTGGQFLLPLYGISGFTLFGILAILICLSLVPVSLADRSNPTRPGSYKFDLRKVWQLSPMASIGCISIGMTNSAFRLVGPIYAQEIGLSIASVATFISAGIIGGAVLQYPLGWWSDRYDRRWALIMATTGAAAAGLFLSYAAGTSQLLNYLGIFCFGAFAMPLYSLSAAHANDRATKDDYVTVSAGLIFFFSLGAMIGPAIGSALIEYYDARALFAFTSTVHGLLVIITLWRMRSRASVPADGRSRFVGLLRTSSYMARLGRKKSRRNGERK